jgi:hypothetical protein
MSHYFDPSETIRGIQQLLVSDKKKIAFLFGAGTSLSKKNNNSPTIPAVAKMTTQVVDAIKKVPEFASAINGIQSDITDDGKLFTIETLLSNIEEKISVVGKGKLNDLSKKDLNKLDDQIKEKVLSIVSVHKTIDNKAYKNMSQCDFASWIKSANRKHAVEIFTTNYDYLFEIGLESGNIPYYDGFTGSYKPFFNANSLDDLNYLSQQTKLWKIHGSLGLHKDDTSGNIIRSSSNKDDLLIYPSSLKYNNSKKQPYASFMDRLNSFLRQDDAVLFICGYSFGDEHINERIISALQTNTTAHVFVIYHDIVWNGNIKSYDFKEESPLALIAKNNRKISVLSSRNAVIGSKYGTWKLKREPDKEDSLNVNWYFDEDAPMNENVPLKEEQNGNESWTGEGELKIIDFSKFTSFLQHMIPKDEWETSDNE